MTTREASCSNLIKKKNIPMSQSVYDLQEKRLCVTPEWGDGCYVIAVKHSMLTLLNGGLRQPERGKTYLVNFFSSSFNLSLSLGGEKIKKETFLSFVCQSASVCVCLCLAVFLYFWSLSMHLSFLFFLLVCFDLKKKMFFGGCLLSFVCTSYFF